MVGCAAGGGPFRSAALPPRGTARRIGPLGPLTSSARSGTLRRMEPAAARNPLAELRRGVLEYCVLALVRDEESYGFDIVRALTSAGNLLTSEGTIYPLLARLRRDGLVTTTWRESGSGPPRRYYRVTNEGRRALDAFATDWRRFAGAVDDLLAGTHGGDTRGR